MPAANDRRLGQAPAKSDCLTSSTRMATRRHVTSLSDVVGASSDETQDLKRNTLWPKQDFIFLPLEAEMVRPIMAAVGGTVPRGLIHVQIQKEGRLQLGLYDNFALDSMFFGPGLTPSFIATMQEAGVLTHRTERYSTKTLRLRGTSPTGNQ